MASIIVIVNRYFQWLAAIMGLSHCFMSKM